MSGSGQERRPAGLRGREIGMYYRKLGQKRRQEQGLDNKPRINLGPSVNVPPEILSKVEEYLHNAAQNNDSEKVSDDFQKNFHNLLNMDFDTFLLQEKENHIDVPSNGNLNNRLKNEILSRENSQIFRQRFEVRRNLPVMKQSETILKAYEDHQVMLIIGSTGCGKTTQVPQIILDDNIYKNKGGNCNIVCTQPRRISAITVAERVAFERCEKLGTSVGYQIRLESQMPRENGCILYCTTGVLLQKMRSNPLLHGTSVVILDEIHERSVESDLLMGLLKKIIPHRPDLKVILMSATVSERDFCEYFDCCYTLRVEGTLHPVKVQYLEEVLKETGYTKFLYHTNMRQRKNSEKDMLYNNMIESYIRKIKSQYDTQILNSLRCSDSEGCENLGFIEHLIFHICEHKPPGAILVFLPGFDTISKLHSMLQKPSSPTGQRLCQKIKIYTLHSMMPSIHQRSVFDPAPNGIRKVILSTVIAETSVTIDDVVYVINTGRTKVQSYNVSANLQTLEQTWVTKANTKQRRGRAGRVQPGICYNLFTRAREETMDEVPTPEILCCKLESIILGLKFLRIADVANFLTTLLSPPSLPAIEHGITLLKRIEALDSEGIITPLGMHLARLPLEPQMGKMLLMAALFRCMHPITSVAAGLSFKSPFFTPIGQEKKVDFAKRNLANGLKSDHLLTHKVLDRYQYLRQHHSERDFCYKNFLSSNTIQQLEKMKQQFADLLKSSKFIETSDYLNASVNVDSKNVPLLRAIITAGLYPNMAKLKKLRQIKNRVFAKHHMSTPEDRKVDFHPSSVNAGEASFDSHYFVYFQKQKSSAVYLMDSTMIYPMALIIFGDRVETGKTDDGHNYISIGYQYYFKCDVESAKVFLKLREQLDLLMKKKALYPAPIEANSSESYIISAIQLLLSMNEIDDYEGSSDNEDT